MTEIEREYTYLINELPEDLDNFPSRIIEDIYIPKDSIHPIMRIRRNGNKYTITKKHPVDATEEGTRGDSSRQIEHNIPLTFEEYKALAKTPGKRFIKRRFSYKVDGHDADIDVYLDELAGLVVIDFEFDSDEAMEKFKKPAFVGKDVTQEKLVAGGLLAGKKYQDIGDKLKEKYDYDLVKNTEKYREEKE